MRARGPLRHSAAALVGLGLAAILAGMVSAAKPHRPAAHVSPRLLTEAQARQRAVAILLGEPYGHSEAEVAATLHEVVLVRSGDTACGEVWRPVWSIHVVVPGRALDGTLLLDGSTGRRVCATLPYLD